jgi:hypothetical protein
MSNIYIESIINRLVIHGLTDESEIEYCKNRISNAIRGKSCVDNFRISIDGKNDKVYKEQIENGCCGFYDEEIVLNSGTKVKFGFNYGH